jgi:hypothetical protein
VYSIEHIFLEIPLFFKKPIQICVGNFIFFGGDSGVQSKPEKIWKLASKEKKGSYLAIKE